MTRRTRAFGLCSLALVVLFALMAVHAAGTARAAAAGLKRQAGLVRRLGLTDLCLSTEANYTRHPALADLHTAFQDHPLALDHFPSGALFGPPPHLGRGYDRRD